MTRPCYRGSRAYRRFPSRAALSGNRAGSIIQLPASLHLYSRLCTCVIRTRTRLTRTLFRRRRTRARTAPPRAAFALHCVASRRVALRCVACFYALRYAQRVSPVAPAVARV